MAYVLTPQNNPPQNFNPKNLNIVKYFLNDANRTQKSLLAHVVAPDFIFTAPLMHPRDFASYVRFTGSYSSNRQVNIDHIHSDDDVNFDVEYTITFGKDTQSSRQRSGKLNIIFRNGLIQELRFHNHFTATPD